MPAGNELVGVETFLIAKLKADTALVALVGGSAAPRIYTDMLPPGLTNPFPHVLIACLSAIDRNALPATARILCRVRYLVKAVTREDTWSNANAIAKRIEVALLGKEGAVSAEGIYVHPVYRERIHTLVETDADGRRINNRGGEYRSEIVSYP